MPSHQSKKLMIVHFDSNQEYQLESIKSITSVFEGKPLSGGDFEFHVSPTGTMFSENGFGNRLALSEDQVLKNVKSIQQRNENKKKIDELKGMNFSIEMETVTGKTYVYLRTTKDTKLVYPEEYILIAKKV
jgi:type III restriction enzyme